MANPRTTRVMKIPGGANYSHKPRRSARFVYASIAIWPQLSTAPGPLHPSPKNDRNASVNKALEIVNTVADHKSGMTFGKMRVRRMKPYAELNGRARSVYCPFSNVKECARRHSL